MEVLHRSRTVVNGLLSHMLCSISEVRRNPDAITRSSTGSTGEFSLCKGGSLIFSSPVITSVGKRLIGTRSLVLVGSGIMSAKYDLLANCQSFLFFSNSKIAPKNRGAKKDDIFEKSR